MFFFDGSECSICKNKLKRTDDVVACPVCGAPHHRSCYKENGGCAYVDRHEEGYSWKAEANADDFDATGSEAETGSGAIKCGVCSCENPKGRLYCRNCGKPLFDDPSGVNSGAAYSSRGAADGEIPDGEMINGVPSGDFKRFLGNSSMIYVPLFIRMARTGKKVAFNFFALLFTGLWMISRKMYSSGIALMALQLGLFTFQCYYQLLIPTDQSQLVAFVMERPLLSCAFVACTGLNYAIMVLIGLFGNRIYMNWCVKKIKRINSASRSTDEFNSALAANSGSGFGIAIVFAMVYFIAELAVAQWFVGLFV